MLHNTPSLGAKLNLRSILKRNIYSCGRQYASKNDLWDAILTAAKYISSDEIEPLISSMDQKLFSLVNKNGSYVNYYLYCETKLRRFFVIHVDVPK